MTEKEWMQEGFDLKLAALLYRKKIWVSIVCAMAGAALAGGLYFLVHVIYAPAREYEAVSKLYLTFAADDDGDAYQYYNGYTWNDLMGTEPILDKIMEELPEGFERADVKNSITADILSDIRLLTITVTTHDPDRTQQIVRAGENALIRFGGEMIEFDKIEVIDHGQAALVAVEDETVRAVIAGAVAGFLLSLLGLAFARIMDDSVYVPSDFEKRYPYPVLGVCFDGKPELGKRELEEHIAFVSELTESVFEIDTAEKNVKLPDGCIPCRGVMAVNHGMPIKYDMPESESMEKDAGIILYIPYGRGNGKLLERWICEAMLYGCEILGAVITGADERLYRLYFALPGKGTRPGQKEKEKGKR